MEQQKLRNNEYRKAYYEANKEKVKEANKLYYQKHEDKLKAYQKEYRKVNPSQTDSEYNKAYYQANKEKFKEKAKASTVLLMRAGLNTVRRSTATKTPT